MICVTQVSGKIGIAVSENISKVSDKRAANSNAACFAVVLVLVVTMTHSRPSSDSETKILWRL